MDLIVKKVHCLSTNLKLFSPHKKHRNSRWHIDSRQAYVPLYVPYASMWFKKYATDQCCYVKRETPDMKTGLKNKPFVNERMAYNYLFTYIKIPGRGAYWGCCLFQQTGKAYNCVYARWWGG